MKNKNSKFFKASITTGILLMTISGFIFLFYNTGFLSEVHSEIFGVGIGLFVLGLAAKLFGIKL